jgi:hypothetical protein
MFDRVKAMFAPKPPRIFQHPTYGRFEAEHSEECWIAQVPHDGAQLGLSVLGSESQPDETRMQAVNRVFAELPSLRAAALDFIVREQPESAGHEFTLTGLDFGCISGLEPGDFEFEFARTGDIDGIWRVVFTSGTPTHLGRDS